MPKISDEHRAKRRAEILDAAWRCFCREGVQATTMEEIIAASGLSASAMYRYFTGKDDIIVAAITTSLGALTPRLDAILDAEADKDVPKVVGELTAEIERFSNRPGYNLMTIALHGWSEAQRNERLRDLMTTHYAAFRRKLTQRVRRWQREGRVSADAAPGDVAQMLLSIVLGYVVQSALLRNTTSVAHTAALAALGEPRRLRDG